jgi:hypothetical protein
MKVSYLKNSIEIIPEGDQDEVYLETIYELSKGIIQFGKDCFLAGRRTLREEIKSDLSIGKLEVEDWPESLDY